MKPSSWLWPALLGSEAAASTLDKLTGYEGGIVLGKVITQHQQQRLQTDGERHRQDGSPVASPGANTIAIDLNVPQIRILRNQTKPVIHTQIPSEPPEADSPPITITTTTTLESAPAPPDQPQQRDQQQQQQQHTTADTQPVPDHDDPGPDAESAPAATTSNDSPAPASRAIAGMSAGLLGVMFIFTVFL